jgi:glycosyltransferase involved in cell wall biosynthesis
MKVQDRETDAHFEPNPDALFAILQALCQSDPRDRKLPLVEREKSVSQFHWGVAAKALGALFKDMAASQ